MAKRDKSTASGRVSWRISEETRNLLAKRAKAEGRSVNAMANALLRLAVHADVFLPLTPEDREVLLAVGRDSLLHLPADQARVLAAQPQSQYDAMVLHFGATMAIRAARVLNDPDMVALPIGELVAILQDNLELLQNRQDEINTELEALLAPYVKGQSLH